MFHSNFPLDNGDFPKAKKVTSWFPLKQCPQLPVVNAKFDDALIPMWLLRSEHLQYLEVLVCQPFLQTSCLACLNYAQPYSRKELI